MYNLLLTLIATCCLITVVLAFVSIFAYRRLKSQVYESIYQFVSAPDEKTPSKLAQTVEMMSHIAGHSIAMEVKTTLMGKESGASRQEGAIIGDIVQDQMANSNPVMGMILNSFPTLSKRVRKHPELAMIASQALSNIASKSAPNPGNGQVRFKL